MPRLAVDDHSGQRDRAAIGATESTRRCRGDAPAQRRELRPPVRWRCRLPAGWTAKPASQPFSFARAGERASYRFTVTAGHDRRASRTRSMRWRRRRAQRVSRRLRADRSSRSRGPLPLSRRRPPTVRGVERDHGGGIEGRLRDGRRRSRCRIGLQQLGAQVTLLGERELASADLSRLRHHHDRHARVRGARRSQDLQLAPARLRAGTAATWSCSTTRRSWCRTRSRRSRASCRASAEEVSEEDSPVTILAPTHQAFTWPNQITQRRLRRLGRAARLEVLHEVGRGVYADDLDVRQRTGAAERRLADARRSARGRGPTSPTRYIGSCPTACRRVPDHGQSACA